MMEILPGQVDIVLFGKKVRADVVDKSPQDKLHSEDFPALIVKVDGVLNTFAHKSLNGQAPYWEMPADE